MLRLFRVRAWCLITAVLLAVGTTTAAFDEFLHAGTPSHDAGCAPLLEIPHDASNHRVGAEPEDVHATGHCVACHWARSPRLGAQSLTIATAADEALADQPIRTIGAVRPAAISGLPARSPPRFS